MDVRQVSDGYLHGPVTIVSRFSVYVLLAYLTGRKERGSLSLSVYVALTYVPEGELLTGFAMRSDPNVVFGFSHREKRNLNWFVTLMGKKIPFLNFTTIGIDLYNCSACFRPR